MEDVFIPIVARGFKRKLFLVDQHNAAIYLPCRWREDPVTVANRSPFQHQGYLLATRSRKRLIGNSFLKLAPPRAVNVLAANSL